MQEGARLMHQNKLTTTDAYIRAQLSYAYRILADFGWDDWTYTHLSARPPGATYFFILPFGLLFEEVTPQSLLKVDFAGNILEGYEENYNRTGYMIHAEVYRARADLNALFHLHTVAGVAVSTLENGLLPLSQFALHFYDQIAYHNYDSLVLDPNQSSTLAQDLGMHKIMFLRHHGTLTAGATLDEAFFYTRHLENACRVQIAALKTQQKLLTLSPDTCKKAVNDLLTFEKNLGERDWKAAIRRVQRVNPIPPAA